MKRILFVDDEPRVLDGLKRMLYPFRNDWDMVFVLSGSEALQQLAESKFDVLMTDVRMPQMSGIELLAEVAKRHPQIVRMVLSGTADQEMTLRSVTLAHQYLVKPCDAKTLRTKVEHALNFHRTLDNPVLKQIIARMHSLPSIPSVYMKLMGALQSPNVSIREIGEIIAQDLGMTAKVLQLVNSAFFGMGRNITTPAEAAVYLVSTRSRLWLSVFPPFRNSTPRRCRSSPSKGCRSTVWESVFWRETSQNPLASPAPPSMMHFWAACSTI